MNSVLCTSAPEAAEVSFNPSKNKTNGTLPPMSPIPANCVHCFWVSFFSWLNSLNINNRLNKKMATIMFLRKVKTDASIPSTPNLFMNMENPLMTAVAKTSRIALFLSIIFEESKRNIYTFPFFLFMPKKLAIGWFSFSCCEDSTIVFSELLNDHFKDWVKLVDFKHVRILKKNNSLENLDVAFVEGGDCFY